MAPSSDVYAAHVGSRQLCMALTADCCESYDHTLVRLQPVTCRLLCLHAAVSVLPPPDLTLGSVTFSDPLSSFCAGLTDSSH